MKSIAINRKRMWSLLAIILLPWCQTPALLGGEPKGNIAGDTIRLHLRTRAETFKGSGDWDEITIIKDLPVRETAIIICDGLDKHWCPSPTKRYDALAQTMP